MMTTQEMITALRRGESVDPNEVAYRLYELTKVIDDMTNDHYTDYLEWYAQRCWELEEENVRLREEKS